MDVKIYNINKHHHKSMEGYTNPLLATPNIYCFAISLVKSRFSYRAYTVEKSDLQKIIYSHHDQLTTNLFKE